MILLDLYGSLWINLPWGGGLGEVLSHFRFTGMCRRMVSWL